jgi:hypothetical protein
VRWSRGRGGGVRTGSQFRAARLAIGTDALPSGVDLMVADHVVTAQEEKRAVADGGGWGLRGAKGARPRVVGVRG